MFENIKGNQHGLGKKKGRAASSEAGDRQAQIFVGKRETDNGFEQESGGTWFPLASLQLSCATKIGRKWKGNQGERWGGIPVIHTGDGMQVLWTQVVNERIKTMFEMDSRSQYWQRLDDSIDWRWRDKLGSKATLKCLEREMKTGGGRSSWTWGHKREEEV